LQSYFYPLTVYKLEGWADTSAPPTGSTVLTILSPGATMSAMTVDSSSGSIFLLDNSGLVRMCQVTMEGAHAMSDLPVPLELQGGRFSTLFHSVGSNSMFMVTLEENQLLRASVIGGLVTKVEKVARRLFGGKQ
jgi:hypothetical protein